VTNIDIESFIVSFATAWAARDGDAFLALWHPEGRLYTPLVARPVLGAELKLLVESQIEAAPDFVWQLIGWTSRADVIVIEWQTSRFIAGKRFDWRGVDKIILRDGKIFEERVYTDTALLRALRSGVDIDAIRAAAALGVAHEPITVI
jgi:SnoaL-like domain